MRILIAGIKEVRLLPSQDCSFGGLDVFTCKHFLLNLLNSVGILQSLAFSFGSDPAVWVVLGLKSYGPCSVGVRLKKLIVSWKQSGCQTAGVPPQRSSVPVF